MSDMRTCTGSKTFGIESHEAPVEDFPAQPSQKDGLGRLCKPHWTAYTRALRTANRGLSGTRERSCATVRGEVRKGIPRERAGRGREWRRGRLPDRDVRADRARRDQAPAAHLEAPQLTLPHQGIHGGAADAERGRSLRDAAQPLRHVSGCRRLRQRGEDRLAELDHGGADAGLGSGRHGRASPSDAGRWPSWIMGSGHP